MANLNYRTLEQACLSLRLRRKFDTDAYRAQNPDVAQSGMGALTHYVRFGQYEGRTAPLKVSARDGLIRASNGPLSKQIRGNLEVSQNSPVIRGWIAAMGDDKPRTARIVLPTGAIRVIASQFREDLRENRINQGAHGFSVSVPPELFDGRQHIVNLIDDATGHEVARNALTWTPPKRPYENFEGYLAYTLTQPVVTAPFYENDKRAFAAMEAFANQLEAHAKTLSTPPLVTVIMPVYNREQVVGKAIESVLSQTYPHLELLVVDDGSEDASVSIAEAFDDARVRVLKLGQNQGPAKARNTAFRVSRGDIIAYLDSDNTWDPRYLGATVGVYAMRPDTAAVASGRIVYRGDESFASSVIFGHLNKGLLANQNYLDTNCLSHKRTLFDQEPPFDESITRYLDYDLCLRLAEEGHLLTCPLILCNYFSRRAANTLSGGKPFSEDLEQIHRKHDRRAAQRRVANASLPLLKNVTVVIPSWEARDDIADCLSAIFSLTWGGRLEVVIVDNASSSDVRSYLRGVADEQEYVTLLENERNYGFTYAVNQGIALARLPESDILLLNNDAIVLPGAIQRLQRAAYNLPEAGITLPRQVLPAGTRTFEDHVPFASPLRPIDVNISAHHRNVARIGVFCNGGPIELSYGPFFAAYIRRDTLDAIGPLDAEHGRHYRSDRVYCDLVRMVAQRRIYHVPDAEILHKLQQSTDILSRQQNNDFDRIFRKNQWSEEEMRSLGYRRRAWDS